MTIVIVLAAFAVMGLAAIAGTGRFGQWTQPVDDSPKGRMPPGDLTDEFLAAVRIPRAMHGYAVDQVDEGLRDVVAGDVDPHALRFDIRTRGYDMAFVDEILDRAVARPAQPVDADAGVEAREEADGPIAAAEDARPDGDGRLGSTTTEN